MSLPMSSAKEEARLRKMTTACEICNKPFTCQSALEVRILYQHWCRRVYTNAMEVETLENGVPLKHLI